MEALNSFLFFLWFFISTNLLKPGFILLFLIVFFSIYFYHKFSVRNKQVIANKDSDINRYPWLWYAESFGIVFISFIVAVGILGKFREIEEKDSKNKSKKEEQKKPDKEVRYPRLPLPMGAMTADERKRHLEAIESLSWEERNAEADRVEVKIKYGGLEMTPAERLYISDLRRKGTNKIGDIQGQDK